MATDRLAFLGWCWVIGATGAALVTFAWLWTGASLDRVLPLQLAVVALAGASYAFGRRKTSAVPAAPVKSFATWEHGLFGAVVAVSLALTVTRALLGSLEPLWEGDDAAFWSMKAKIIYASGGFNEEFAEVMAIPQIVYHKDYPLLNTLLHVWTFLHAGEITHVLNRLPTQMFGVAFVLILAAALRRVARPAVAAALLLCVMSLPETVHQNRTAYVDLSVAVCLVMAFDAWNRWSRSDSDATAGAWWRLFCLTLACLVWLKHEGLFYVTAMLAAWAVSRLASKRRLDAARPADKRLLLLPAGVLLLTWSFNAWFGFQSYVLQTQPGNAGLMSSFVRQLPERLPVITSYFAEHIVLNPEHSNLLPLGFLIVSAGIVTRIWRSDLRLPTLALVFAFGAYLAVFVATPAEITSHLRTAAERVSYQLVPAIALWLGAAGGLLFSPLGSASPDSE